MAVRYVDPSIVRTWPEEDQRAYYEAVLAEGREERQPLWFTRPDIWVEDNLLASPTFYQSAFFRGVAESKRATSKGPRGLGKTFNAAAVLHWFMRTREAAGVDWKAAATSGSWAQLIRYLWPEVRKLNRLLVDPWPDSMLLTTSFSGKYGQAFCASPKQPELIEGIHADSVLVLFDEAKIIRPAVFDSIEGAALNAESQETFFIAQSTPGAPMGRFHDLHSGKPGYDDWFVQSVPLEDVIAAGRASQSEVDRLGKQWGIGSAMYRQHVLGEFAADDESSIIPLAWVELAVERWEAWHQAGRPPQGGPALSGLDVARHGRDATILASADGDVVTELWREAFTDNVAELADRVHPMIAQHDRTTVDGDGLGAGTADRLRTLRGDRRVHVFQGGHKPDGWRDASGELEANSVRSAAWWSLRDRLNPATGATLALPPDDQLISDLVSPRLEYDNLGRIRLEKKDQTSKRLGRSPDAGDAVVMMLWVPTSSHGDEYAALRPDAGAHVVGGKDLSQLPAHARGAIRAPRDGGPLRSMGYS